MQLIITDAWLARSRVIHLTGTQLLAALMTSALVLVLLSVGMYHWVVLKGARDGWPIIGAVFQTLTREDVAQRDRYLRENLDLLARRLGEMQAKLTQLESLGERVAGLAGAPTPAVSPAGSGGALVAARPLSLLEVEQAVGQLEQLAVQRTQAFTGLETELFDQKMKRILLPTQRPVQDGDVGSPFGWRIDPITGASSLHTGLDFPALMGTAIHAAAGGIVVTQQFHPEYGNMVEIDHGNDVLTRYAHAARVWVKKGDLVRRGQKIADVGTSGRSTGAHLHFEVWVAGTPQDPQKFLDAGQAVALARASATAKRGAPVVVGHR